VFSQSGFSFLDLPASARVAALGGIVITPGHDDVAMAFHNPVAVDSTEASSLGLMVNPYFAGISRYSIGSKWTAPYVGDFHVGTSYTHYGDFTRRDNLGQETGDFNARDFVFYLGKAHRISHFTLGVNLKWAGSYIDNYSQSAILFDFGGMFSHPSLEWTIAMTMNNLGFITGGMREQISLPSDVRIGTTFKPKYMPIRFSFTVFDLISSEEPFSIEENIDSNVLGRSLRHLNFGGAFLLGKNVEILAGYNHNRRQELRLAEGAYGAGLSFGLLLKLKRFAVRFSRSTFHAAGGTSFFVLNTNLNSFKKIF
jgi:hypothetical protein